MDLLALTLGGSLGLKHYFFTQNCSLIDVINHPILLFFFVEPIDEDLYEELPADQ